MMKLDNGIKHEWFSAGPGGYLKEKTGQSKGGNPPEEGRGSHFLYDLSYDMALQNAMHH